MADGRTSPELYGESLALLTDLYELTMACGYWRAGVHEERAVFELFFRSLPFGGGFAIACGIESALAWLERFRFEPSDLDYLAGLKASDGRPLFPPEFLDFLGELRLRVDLDAMPEGHAVFPREPLVRVEGPVLECQLLETALLTLLNFQTLIATKAARVRLAAGEAPVLEFGLRRAQGIDGGLSASRAAYVGGCDATSNTLAGRLFGIPVRGTHAHSWVMFFGDEQRAFEAWVEAFPADSILLVDTFETRSGIEHALAVARELQARGGTWRGIRIDSGDLAALAREARARLDRAGFRDARIVASGDLDEHEVARLREQGAPIDVWGVGTRLVTAFDEPALGGVYKLVGVRDAGRKLRPRLKLSDDPAKSTLPGAHQVRRYRARDRYVGDVIFDLERPPARGCEAVDLADARSWRRFDDALAYEDLLEPRLRKGQRVGEAEPLEAARRRTLETLAKLPPAVLRLRAPERYPIAVEASLEAARRELAEAERRRVGAGESQ